LSHSSESSVTESELLRFERLLSTLSATFINLPAGQMDQAIEESLAQIVATLGIDRSTLHRVLPLTGHIEVTHSFARPGVPLVPKSHSARDMSPWALARTMANQAVVFERLEDLPPEADLDRETYRGMGLKSHVAMPIVVAGQLHGGLSFGSVRSERTWPPELLGRLRMLAEVFGSALARKRAQEELDNATSFEGLAIRILASLALAQPEQRSHAIGLGLRDIGQFVGAERVALWHATGRNDFALSQHWHADNFVPPTGRGSVSDIPWICAQLARGNVVRLSRLSELQECASADREALQALEIRSLLIVPIVAAGRSIGALSMASVARENQWPDALTPGVSLLAEVFGNLQAREASERRKLAAEVEAAHWRERLAHIVRVHTAGEMSVALAHEITQPLGAIENYAIAARRRIGEAEPDLGRLADLLDKILGQATRAGDVVTRMRSMAQLHEIEPKSINVARAVEECIGMVRMDCEMRAIHIRLLPGSTTPIAMVDEIHLQQVILNLMRNAMEAIEYATVTCPRDIVISISAGKQDEIVVEVADRGVGIAEGDLERIFESFYSTKSSGLGVGLAICRKLIEAHGGQLWASHHPAGGALFRFTLPNAAPVV
jgi:signal transduction histidine kinase